MWKIGFVVSLALIGCGGSSGADLGAADLAMSAADLAAGDAAPCTAPSFKEDVSACKPAMTDYTPRDNMSKNDPWPACICDDNLYHAVDPNSISTIARIKAFEEVAKKLWEGGKTPAAADFGDAKILYTTPEGLDSRVQRRQDIHYPELPMGKACNQMGVPEMYPDRCAGPIRILPILNDAFQKGAAGDKVLVQAARVEAGLLWFLYLSMLSESWSTATSLKDVDSMWAYYGGGNGRDNPLGLGRYIKAQGPATHDRSYDGLLAVRCWRHLENDMTPAKDLTTGDRARAQLDRALLRGMALLLRQRVGEVKCATGERAAAHLAFVKVVGGFLDRAARAVDAAKADALKKQVEAATPDAVDVAAAQAAIDSLFPCP